MRTKIFVALGLAVLMAASALHAGDGEFKWTGTLGIGGQYVDTSDTKDEGKMREYRDLTSGLLTFLDLRGRGHDYYLDFLGENLGNEDMYLNLKGGKYGSLKYQLFSDSLQHFFATDARTPYAGSGSTNQTATLPNRDFESWNVYDLEYKRRNDGGMVEFSFNSPWYLRADVNQVTFDGSKLQGYAQGTGSGNGFVDLAVPVDYKTTNYTFEGGYSSRRVHVDVSYLDSKFKNSHEIVDWTNGYFGNNNPPVTTPGNGTDASYLPNDNGLKRWSFNGSVTKLPLNSTLMLRISQSESTSDVTMATSQLIGSATARSTLPFSADPSRFAGKIDYDVWTASWVAKPTNFFDVRLYAGDYKRKNKSSQVIFSGFQSPTNSLGCVGVIGGTGPIGSSTGPRICESEPFGFDRSNYGAEASFKLLSDNRIRLFYDEQETDREYHADSDNTKDKRYGISWRNSSFGVFGFDVKYERLERDSNLLVNPVLPNTVWSYDVANMERDVAKIGLDFMPGDNMDFGVEYYYKKSKYKDSPAGRTSDERNEIYVSAGFGDVDNFRVKLYYDYEDSDSKARLVSRNNTSGLVNYTVFHDVGDRFTGYGIGFDWPVSPDVMVAGSATYNESKGTVDFNGLAGASALPATLVPIPNYGNNDRLSLNLSADWTFNAKWGLKAGVAYEDASYDDIQFYPYAYTLPVNGLTNATVATASYLTGYYSEPDYTATIVYALAKFSF